MPPECSPVLSDCAPLEGHRVAAAPGDGAIASKAGARPRRAAEPCIHLVTLSRASLPASATPPHAHRACASSCAPRSERGEGPPVRLRSAMVP